MKTPRGFFEDPWLKRARHAKRLPKDALFACTYDLDINGPDIVPEACFLRRTKTRDELWLVGLDTFAEGDIVAGNVSPRDIERGRVLDLGCAYAVPKKGDDLSACLDLLYRLFSARVGFYWPTGFVAAGIVQESAFNSLVGRLKHELEDNAEKARLRETEIILVARELELNPQPTGTGPDYWQATCPRTNHPLYINAAENSFGCGWCRRKGGIEELRAFVKERRER